MLKHGVVALGLVMGAVSAWAQAPLRMGAAWYPEQWPESRWEVDLQLMQDAHMNVVRVGEFAWSSMEPREGEFTFGWLDRAIALAAKHHIAVVLGTPTAAPPAWLTTKYPDTLRVNEDGRREEHGNRQQFSFASARYRRMSARIANEMATRYGKNRNVIGWQIDNEIVAPSFDEEAKAQFHAWLKKKYVTVGELNRRWATAYWSQTYDTFDEVPVHSKGENPALLLDWKRFATDEWVDYVANQVAVIRPRAAAGQFITTNTMHWNTGFDHYAVHQDLDMAAWDDYFPDGKLDAALNAASHDLVRGYKRKNFWLMETQPGFVNWGPVNASLAPGVTREMAWQAVGHGADAVLYWQWRSALNGQEEYHGTLVGPDGTPVPVYDEVKQFGAELERVNALLAGTHVTASVAILNSYDSHWAIDFQKHTKNFDYVEQVMDLYRQLEPLASGVDIVSADVDLSRYKVVFAPALNVLREKTAKNLLAYVSGGGHLVLGPRSGMKDGDDALDVRRQPGALGEALGGRVEQYYALDKPVKLSGAFGEGSAAVWAETLVATAPDAKVMMTYGQDAGWLAGKPGALRHGFGKGTITYVGATLDAGSMRGMVASALAEGNVTPFVANLPKDVEVMERADGGKTVWIVMNHGTKEASLAGMPAGMRRVDVDGEHGTGLKAHGVAVFTMGTR